MTDEGQRIRELRDWFGSRPGWNTFGGQTVADLIDEALDDDPGREVVNRTYGPRGDLLREDRCSG